MNYVEIPQECPECGNGLPCRVEAQTGFAYCETDYPVQCGHCRKTVRRDEAASRSGYPNGLAVACSRDASPVLCDVAVLVGHRQSTRTTELGSASPLQGVAVGGPAPIAYETSNDRPRDSRISRLRYFASGSGRIWNLTRFPGSTGPPSTCQAASAPYVA